MRYLVSVCLSLAFVAMASAQSPNYGLGRAPMPEEVQAWDKGVSPSGKGLPPGKGTAKEGAAIYAQRCAYCHGPTGAEGPKMKDQWPYTEGTRAVPPLVGGKGTLASATPVKTIGSFWPYATTVFDYINRAMPPKFEGTLKPDELYALTAFLLYRNDIVKEDEVIDAKSLPQVKMPNRDGFVPAKPERWWKPGIPGPDNP